MQTPPWTNPADPRFSASRRIKHARPLFMSKLFSHRPLPRAYRRCREREKWLVWTHACKQSRHGDRNDRQICESATSASLPSRESIDAEPPAPVHADAGSLSDWRSRLPRTCSRPGLERPRRRSRSTVTSAGTALHAEPPGPSGCDQNARKGWWSAGRYSRYRTAPSASPTLVMAPTQRAKSSPTGLLVSSRGRTPAQPISTETNRIL